MQNSSSFFYKNLNILERMLNLNLNRIQDEKSSYWKEKINKFDFRDPESFLNSGSFTKRSIKQKIFHYLNQRLYFSKLLGINIFKTGVYRKSIKIAKKQKRILDYDFLRMVFTYYFIAEIKKIKFQKICIIGDGKSTLTSIFRTMHPSIQIFYVNLIETTIQDYLILSQSKIINQKDHIIVQNKNDLNFYKKLYFVPSFNAHFLKDKDINLFINICSFQEMEPNILENYFEIISSNKSILYHCNRLEKKLDDGHIVRTDQYPIKNGKVIFNEQCPWHSFYYAPIFKKKYFAGVNEGRGINHFIINFNN